MIVRMHALLAAVLGTGGLLAVSLVVFASGGHNGAPSARPPIPASTSASTSASNRFDAPSTAGSASPTAGTSTSQPRALSSPSLQPAAQTAAQRPFFGIAVPRGELGQLAGITRDAGAQPTVWQDFIKLDSSFNVSDLNARYSSGLTPFLTLDPWSWRSEGPSHPEYSLQTIYSRDHDAALIRIADMIEQYHHPVFLRFAHEMNTWWTPWAESTNGNKPGDYVKAWRHTFTLMNSRAPGLISWVWAPNALIPNHANTTPIDELYPGDEYVDYTGLTCYGHEASAIDSCGPTLDAISKLSSKPIILAETGADGSAQAAWISSLSEVFDRYSQLIGFVWFNTDPKSSGASGYYEFNTSPESIAAFQRVVASIT